MISLMRIYQLRSKRYAAYFILLCKQAFPGALRRWLCYFKKQWTSVCASFELVILVVYCQNSRGRVTHFRRATLANYLVSASIGVHHFVINHSHHDASLISSNSVHVTGNLTTNFSLKVRIEWTNVEFPFASINVDHTISIRFLSSERERESLICVILSGIYCVSRQYTFKQLFHDVLKIMWCRWLRNLRINELLLICPESSGISGIWQDSYDETKFI